MYEGIGVATTGLKVRKAPVDGVAIGTIGYQVPFKGSEIVVAKDGLAWMHVVEVNGKVLDGWAMEKFLQYTEITTPPVPPPPPPVPTTTEYILYVHDGVSEKFIKQ